jgi:rod shape determining protein RodA
MLIAFGVMNIYSVEPDKGIRQLVFFGLSFILIIGLLAVSSSSQNFFEIYSPLFYLVAVLLLIAVRIFGKEINGARAWFDFGFVSFQPAEFAKLATGLFLANYISTPALELNSRKTILTAFAIIGIPVFLILLQPDLGSVLVFSAFIVALYREGFSPWYIFIPVIGGVLFLVSISYPPYLILTAIGLIVAVIGLCIIAFTYNRTTLKTVMGMQMGLVIYFLALLLLMFAKPEWGMIRDTTSKQFMDLGNLAFNVYFYAGTGFLIALLSALAVGYFMIYNNADSPFKTSSSEFGSNLTFGTAAVSTGIFIIITGISLFSSTIYAKLPKHQQERIMVLFEGEAKYRDTSGYNLLYSKTAIGSGDLLGKGYNQGTVKMGKFVPEQSTDYIFCTVGEEWGFLGSTVLIIFYGLFIARIYYLAETIRNEFSRFFGYSVATVFLIHFFINIAMVMGLFPTVGIPLPFFSYGGSSLWAFVTLVTIFLILNYKDKQSLI